MTGSCANDERMQAVKAETRWALEATEEFQKKRRWKSLLKHTVTAIVGGLIGAGLTWITELSGQSEQRLIAEANRAVLVQEVANRIQKMSALCDRLGDTIIGDQTEEQLKRRAAIATEMEKSRDYYTYGLTASPFGTIKSVSHFPDLLLVKQYRAAGAEEANVTKMKDCTGECAAAMSEFFRATLGTGSAKSVFLEKLDNKMRSERIATLGRVIQCNTDWLNHVFTESELAHENDLEQ